MILGIGIDLTEKKRFIKIMQSNTRNRFILRVLTQEEQKYLQHTKYDIDFIAKRWACKEAISKAFGCGIGKNLSFLDINIIKNEHGKPIVKINKNYIQTPIFSGNPENIFIHISISDTKNVAIANCVIEGYPCV